MSLLVTQLIGFAARPPSSVSITKTADPVSGANLTEYTFAGAALGDVAVDRQTIVHVASYGNAVSALTVGGVSATLVVAEVDTVVGNRHTSIWIAPVPTGATGDIVVTHAGACTSCGIVVYRMVGQLSATATDTSTDDTPASNVLSTTIDVQAGGAAIAGCAMAGGGATLRTATWTGLTTSEVDEVVEVSAGHYAIHDEFTATQTGLTVEATFSGATDGGCMVVAAFR